MKVSSCEIHSLVSGLIVHSIPVPEMTIQAKYPQYKAIAYSNKQLNHHASFNYPTYNSTFVCTQVYILIKPFPSLRFTLITKTNQSHERNDVWNVHPLKLVYYRITNSSFLGNVIHLVME